MKSQPLTKSLKVNILEKLTEHTFSKRQKEIQETEYELGEALRKFSLGKHFDLIERMPPGICHENNMIAYTINGQYNYMKFKKSSRVKAGRDTVVIGHKDKLYKPISKYHNDRMVLKEERLTARRRALAAMDAVNTTKQLIEAWPEIEPFIEAPEEKKALSIPKSDLNALFKLPK